MILLDTSVLIDYFRKVNKQNAFFFQLAQISSEFTISSITKYEIEVGAKPQDMAFWTGLYQNISIISFDEDIASETVAINNELKKKSKLIEFADMAIAATARIHNFDLATLNTKHFNRIDNLRLINPS
jgi:predicted nucleic acid-binding protein